MAASMAEPAAPAVPSWRIVPRLALADMWHETILTICMVVALVAIIAPLMLLLGLRYGSIEMLRNRLVQNPTYREIWPQATLNLNDDWFERMRRRPEVEFVLPTILRGASTIGVRRPDQNRIENFDLIPTATGDPVVLRFAGRDPKQGEAVISRPAATKLGLEAGASVELEVTRQREGRRERERLPTTIIAVLPFEADGLERVYAPWNLAQAVERYREGLAVPELGWAGGAAVVYPSFDGAMVAATAPLSRIDQTNLRIGTGFADVEEMAPERFRELTGHDPPAERTLYDLRMRTTVATNANLDQLRERLRGRDAVVLPYVQPMPAMLGAKETSVVGLSLGANDAQALGLPASPWGGFQTSRSAGKVASVLMSTNEGGERVELTVPVRDSEVTLPLSRAGTALVPTVPLELLAALRTGRERRIAWDPQASDLVLARGGFYGFRLYTRTIEQVPALYRDLIDEGLRVDAHVQEIERIRVLDEGLMRLFLLVATVGTLGGMGALVASLYATVERKKRELGVMRLMGLSRGEVSRFPVYQGIGLAAIGVLSASIVFIIFAGVINVSFAGEVQGEGQLCRLPPIYYLYITALTLGAALLSSLVAARRATKIEPAEAIREE